MTPGRRDRRHAAADDARSPSSTPARDAPVGRGRGGVRRRPPVGPGRGPSSGPVPAVRRHAARGDRRAGRAAGASTCWPGGTSTTPRPAAASSTPTGSSPPGPQAGLDVSMTTSSVPGGRRVVRRDGYRVIRRAGRYSVFPRSILSGAVGRIGTGRRRGRDLERHAVLQPAVVPQPADHLPPPRPRRDVEDGAAPRAWPSSATCSSTGSPRLSTGGAGSSPCRTSSKAEIVERLRLPRRPDHGDPARRRAPVHPGRRALAGAAGGGGRAAWCRSSGSTC